MDAPRSALFEVCDLGFLPGMTCELVPTILDLTPCKGRTLSAIMSVLRVGFENGVVVALEALADLPAAGASSGSGSHGCLSMPAALRSSHMRVEKTPTRHSQTCSAHASRCWRMG
jgi:hypothetical protein